MKSEKEIMILIAEAMKCCYRIQYLLSLADDRINKAREKKDGANV